MPLGLMGDIRQTVFESTSQRENWGPDSLLAAVSNGMDGWIYRWQSAHLCVGRRTQEHEGGEAVPLYPFSGTQAPNIEPGPGGLCL